ncbi:MAG: hypothetical protein IJJ47_13770 [Methanosphaera sp.]|nr:hypothetical protein [Methanosphaera sp.]
MTITQSIFTNNRGIGNIGGGLGGAIENSGTMTITKSHYQTTQPNLEEQYTTLEV